VAGFAALNRPDQTKQTVERRWSIEHMAESESGVAERRIIVTDNAVRRIAMLKKQEQCENAFLRIAVSGGGCSGFQYGFSFDEERHADDVLFEKGGVAVVIDDVSLALLEGAEIDFVEDLMGASFQIRNPNAASSCGCGNSFSIG
jgi:iron-sulfur cluster insertion protein